MIHSRIRYSIAGPCRISVARVIVGVATPGSGRQHLSTLDRPLGRPLLARREQFEEDDSRAL